MNVEQAVNELAEVRSLMKELRDREAKAKEVINENLSLGATPVGNYIVKITETSRWNEATAMRNLDADTLDQISKKKPDSKLAQAILDPDTYKIACCNQSNTITIKEAE